MPELLKREKKRYMASEKVAEENLKAGLQQALDEARMVLPGIQALFGFQLIAVFNDRFEELGSALQFLHLSALLAVAFSIALIMTPAAYHRQTRARNVTAHVLAVTTRFVSAALVPLTLGLSLDLYVITSMVTSSTAVAVAAGVLSTMVYVFFWFVFPRLGRS